MTNQQQIDRAIEIYKGLTNPDDPRKANRVYSYNTIVERYGLEETSTVLYTILLYLATDNKLRTRSGEVITADYVIEGLWFLLSFSDKSKTVVIPKEVPKWKPEQLN